MCALWLGAVAPERALATPKKPQSSASSALAQTSSQASGDELQRSRAAFQRGVELAARGQYVAAVASFREALALHYAATTAFNLASALYEQGNYLEAHEYTQRVLDDPAASPALKERASELEQSLRPQLARLTVALASDERELVIEVDGAALAPAQIGATRVVQPGAHTIAAKRGSTVLSRREVNIPAGTAALVDMSLLAPAQAAVASESVPAIESRRARAAEQEREHKRKRRMWWIIGGSAVAVVGAGVLLGVLLAEPKDEVADPVAGDTNPGVLSW